MAKYKNIKTGFIFETSCTLKGEDWEEISNPLPIKDEEVKEEKPIKTKRTKKYE